MSQVCKIRIRGSDQQPFKYTAAFIWGDSGAPATPLGPADLYAEGDLAAYLEDWGADRKDIMSLLANLEKTPAAEIAVVLTDEQFELLWSRPR